MDELTEREKDVARLLVNGAGNREIAARLHITEGTVRNYIRGIDAKLGVHDRFQAINKLKSLIS